LARESNLCPQGGGNSAAPLRDGNAVSAKLVCPALDALNRVLLNPKTSNPEDVLFLMHEECWDDILFDIGVINEHELFVRHAAFGRLFSRR
jgi:hypothetical protein